MFTRAQQTNNECLVILIDQGLAVLSQNLRASRQAENDPKQPLRSICYRFMLVVSMEDSD